MRVGIIGAGQLGMMLAEAARPLDINCELLDPAEDTPASRVSKVHRAAFDDVEAITALAEQCDVLTYEFENVPVDALRSLQTDTPVYPPMAALEAAQDRLSEKQLFDSLQIPLPGYAAIDSLDDLQDAAQELGLPMVLKTRRFGYDGKGQAVIRNEDDIRAAWDELSGQPLIAEAFVNFDFEVSAIAARNTDGDCVVYPVTRNRHASGILDTSVAPVTLSSIEAQANEYVLRLVDELNYVGVIALELFVVGDSLLANEFAPRVHNSGHWTIEGTSCSQFENHLRAVCNMPLGNPASTSHAGMLNLIGTMPEAARTQDIGVLHDYGKSERPGRKLGHITVTADSAAARDALLDKISGFVT